ncbi:MAG: GTPase ObgE [Owenweeksia sp.]|nr:GTPase ObgE [Owenweeksia sp.]
MSGNFVDYVKIYCKSGKGGAGSPHLHRDRTTPKGGPDGGDGGRGGHVVLRGNEQYWTLLHLKYRKHIKAEAGANGARQQRTGSQGKDEVLEVPLGTVARDGETSEFLFEITEHGQEQVLREGGRGGLGNVHFKSSTFQTPRFAQPGEPAQEGWNILELKILADVGLVGFPNAGKSTLLSVLSAAKPEVADYPFTTLTPNLGMVQYRDFRSFVMADIPGIIEGASEGKGLGHRFLRHIERNAILLFMIPADANDIRMEYDILCRELEKYNPELLDKKHILAITKSDMLDDELKAEITELLQSDLPDNLDWLFISAVTGHNLNQLKDKLWQILNEDG